MPISQHYECKDHKYTSLVYLGFFFIYFIFEPLPKNWEIAANAAGLIIFLICYFIGFKLQGIWKAIPASIMILLGFLLAPTNYGSNVFFPYAGYLGTQIFNTRHSYYFLGAFVSLIIFLSWILNFHAAYWMIAVLITTAVTLAGIADKKIEISNEKLRLSQEEVEELATLAERERIARDLHDLLGHTLSVIILKAELSNKLIANNTDKASKEINEIQTISRDALQQIRSAINNYRHISFQEELRSLSGTLQNSDIQIEKQIDLAQIPIKYEAPLCMILKEAVTNIIRHATATLCKISLNHNNNHIELTISDNGNGSIIKEGNGIRGIRERVKHLNGDVSLLQNQGTTLTITLPS